MADLGELVRVYREQEALAAAETQANADEWRKAQADQLEADGWTEAAARARTQLAETEEAAQESGGYADQTKEDLYAEVQKRGITGMSQANKDELVAALEADDRGELPVEEG